MAKKQKNAEGYQKHQQEKANRLQVQQRKASGEASDHSQDQETKSQTETRPGLLPSALPRTKEVVVRDEVWCQY